MNFNSNKVSCFTLISLEFCLNSNKNYEEFLISFSGNLYQYWLRSAENKAVIL